MKKFYKVLSFTQRRWLKSWIDLCVAQHQNATSEFESNLAKLQANSKFGKTMENVSNRANICLIADSVKLRKAVSKPSYRHAQIINSDLVMVRAAPAKVLLNKQTDNGGFLHLGIINIRNVQILLQLSVTEIPRPMQATVYLYRLAVLRNWNLGSVSRHGRRDGLFDTSNFEPDHPLYSKNNHRVLGKIKRETGSTPSLKFVCLKAKMYSLSCVSCPVSHTTLYKWMSS